MRRDDRAGARGGGGWSVLVGPFAARRGQRVPLETAKLRMGIRSNLIFLGSGRNGDASRIIRYNPIVNPSDKVSSHLRSTYYTPLRSRRKNSGLTHSTRVYPSAVVKTGSWIMYDSVTYSDEITEIRVLTDRRSDHLYFFFFVFFLIKRGKRRRSERRERFNPAIKLCRNRGTIGNTYVQYLITTTKHRT